MPLMIWMIVSSRNAYVEIQMLNEVDISWKGLQKGLHGATRFPSIVWCYNEKSVAQMMVLTSPCRHADIILFLGSRTGKK